MAKLTMKVNGKRGINWHVARTRPVRRAMQLDTLAAARRSEDILDAHRDEGHSQILVERGDVDWYVVLDDSRGLGAAMTIEYGRDGTGEDAKGASEGVAPLRRGVGLVS